MRLLERITALRHRDHTNGSIPKSVLVLSLPLIITNILHSLQSLVDMYFVGQLGKEAVAAVGMSSQVLFVMASFFIGLNIATIAMISRAIGERDAERAGHIAGQVLLLTAGLSVLLGAGGVVLCGDILGGLGAAPDVRLLGESYLQVVFAGTFFLCAMFILSGILQGAGDTVTPLLLGIITTVANVLLNPVFIFGWGWVPAYGVQGSGIATVIARAIALTVGMVILLRGRLPVRVHLHDFRPCFATMLTTFRISLPSALGMGMRTVMNLVLMSIVATFGTVAIAAYAVGLRIRMVTLFPAFGFAGAASTLVGQNLGAGMPERSRHGAHVSAGLGVAVCGVAGILSFIFAPELMVIFNDAPEVVDTGTMFLRMTAVGLLCAPMGIIFNRALSGAGDTLSPMLISFVALWGFQIPAALLLSGTKTLWGVPLPLADWSASWMPGDVTGVWYAMVAASLLQATITIIWFETGRWQRARV